MNLTIYLNGRFIKVSPKDFDRLLPGSLEGEGAFETMRMYDGKIFAFNDHMRRLLRGLKHFGMALPQSLKSISRLIARLSAVNRLRNSRVRVVIWKSKNKRNISISCQPLMLPSRSIYDQGFRVMTAGVARSRTRHSHVKSINYKMFRSAFKEAQLRGFDEALLLNYQGEIVEGTRTNIFFVNRKRLYTPAIRCGALNGITRGKVIECARQLKIPVRTVRAKLSALLKADEAFLTGSTLELMSIKSVDGKTIGSKRPGPVTRALQAAYRQMVAEYGKA
jgi:branched-subunit amino acid aminotransferase/4-amino-4-deoxychorismate lyase